MKFALLTVATMLATAVAMPVVISEKRVGVTATASYVMLYPGLTPPSPVCCSKVWVAS